MKAFISQKFDFISFHEKIFDFISQEKVSVLILSHFISWLLDLTRESFCSDSVSFHLMKDWFHFMKMWSHLSFISSHLIKAWFHFSSDLKSEQNEIFWSQLSNIDYTIQKQQKVLLSSVINADIYNIYINIENQNNS